MFRSDLSRLVLASDAVYAFEKVGTCGSSVHVEFGVPYMSYNPCHIVYRVLQLDSEHDVSV